MLRQKLSDTGAWRYRRHTAVVTGAELEAGAPIELVRRPTPRIKRNLPGARVLGGSVARRDLPDAEQVLQLGLADHIDVFPIHPYREIEECLGRRAAPVRQAKGDDRPMSRLASARGTPSHRRMKRRQLRGFDLKQLNGVNHLIGVDEVGRGAFAGPVVAAAVMVTREFLESRWAVARSGRVNDSKVLSAEQREELWSEFEVLAAEGRIHANPGTATVEEIAQHNILGATKLAMRRALGGLYPPEAFETTRHEPDLFSSLEERTTFQPAVSARIIIDGLPLRSFPYPHSAFVKGDGRSLCIAMASIIAKVTRDRMMVELDRKHPGYGFAQHKGYGTEEHRDAVLRLGRCAEHREAFLRKLLAMRADPAQMDFLSPPA